MNDILAIDPGMNCGLAIYRSGKYFGSCVARFTKSGGFLAECALFPASEDSRYEKAVYEIIKESHCQIVAVEQHYAGRVSGNKNFTYQCNTWKTIAKLLMKKFIEVNPRAWQAKYKIPERTIHGLTVRQFRKFCREGGSNAGSKATDKKKLEMIRGVASILIDRPWDSIEDNESDAICIGKFVLEKLEKGKQSGEQSEQGTSPYQPNARTLRKFTKFRIKPKDGSIIE